MAAEQTLLVRDQRAQSPWPIRTILQSLPVSCSPRAMTSGIVALVGSSAPAVPKISTVCAIPADRLIRRCAFKNSREKVQSCRRPRFWCGLLRLVLACCPVVYDWTRRLDNRPAPIGRARTSMLTQGRLWTSTRSGQTMLSQQCRRARRPGALGRELWCAPGRGLRRGAWLVYPLSLVCPARSP